MPTETKQGTLYRDGKVVEKRVTVQLTRTDSVLRTDTFAARSSVAGLTSWGYTLLVPHATDLMGEYQLILPDESFTITITQGGYGRTFGFLRLQDVPRPPA